MSKKAVRGSIVDRNDDKLAFTIEARALTFQPNRIRKQLAEARAKSAEAPEPQQRLRDIAREVSAPAGQQARHRHACSRSCKSDDILRLPGPRGRPRRSPTRSSDKFPEVGAERQDLRQYPGGSLAANIVGGIDWDGHGLLGLEDSLDSALAGTDGSVTYDRGSDGVVIPGSYRNRHDAVNGSTVAVDPRRRHPVLRPAAGAAGQGLSGAKNVSAVVLDAKTGEVLAMSNDNTFDPSQDIGRQGDRQMGNLSVSSPFEPGSVNKIVTAASAIEYGLTNPDEVLQVPGSIDMGGVTVNDAWNHGVDAVHHHRDLREVLQRRHPDAGAADRPGTLFRHAREVRPRVSAPTSACPARATAWSRRWISGRAARSPTCLSDRVFR